MIIFVGVVAAIVCAAIGVVPVLRAVRSVKLRAAALQLAVMPMVVDIRQSQTNLERLQFAAQRANELLARAKAAIDEINSGIKELKIPQAIFALRAAGAAIRLLLSGR